MLSMEGFQQSPCSAFDRRLSTVTLLCFRWKAFNSHLFVLSIEGFQQLPFCAWQHVHLSQSAGSVVSSWGINVDLTLQLIAYLYAYLYKDSPIGALCSVWRILVANVLFGLANQDHVKMGVSFVDQLLAYTRQTSYSALLSRVICRCGWVSWALLLHKKVADDHMAWLLRIMSR